MKALKIIGYIIIGIIAVFLVVAIFLPGDVYMEESEVIPADPVAVFTQVNDLHNWEKWSPWAEMDPEMAVTYNGAEEGEGAAYSWEGPKAGAGTLTILRSDPYENVHFQLEFEGSGTSEGGFNFNSVNDGTNVTWYMHMEDLKYPVGRWMGVIMQPMLKQDFRKGLENMEKVLVN
jgi:hypothetical protein